MDFSFDKVADTLYIQLESGDVKESDEIAQGIIIDFSKKKKMLGIEILNYSLRNLNLNYLIGLSSDELIPAIVQCP